ncbi:arylsulfatase [Verrucomicrobiaceae bacterium 5K15]|uniref:Arylsulfatase n=1 Tax=Oceaniferula flava TaxID=2800421 RepID=A0AAE2VCB5_9BACT|nr:arylsulfatase [Oceaniferula flavus]MBK1854786.1 arylsulfatase [Oceaniferula flavus]MBM1136092.1 arylsulfatase [Oceaniferula flavus]
MKKATRLSLLATLLASTSLLADKPNIIFILADDMGVGDVSHNGGKAATPGLDRMAEEGMRFTDAHSTSAVCSPTRYGILTGRYNWRSFLKKAVIMEPSKRGAMIKPHTETVAGFLKDNGYHTALIGKWHLGLDWKYLDKARKPKVMGKHKKAGKGWDIDFSQKVGGGPNSVGFDYSFYIAGSLDMAPYVYLKNDLATSIPTHVKAFNRPGPGAADFEAVTCLEDFARESVNYIKERAKTKQPFFLYLPLTSPHTPIVPSKKWKGKSSLGQYGDFLMETDWVVGEVLKALDANKIADNTMVIFTTDNGCSPRAEIPKLHAKGHKPNGDYRGHKADIYEGGHRVPFIVRWPGKAAAGSITDRTITSADFFATVADAIDTKVSESSAVDSFSFLPTLTGKEQEARPFTIHHSISGDFAIRQGKWKLALCPGSGGWSAPRGKQIPADAPPVQLYDLDADPSEQNNVATKHPEKVTTLIKLVNQAITNGRTTPGPKQENDGPVPPFKKKLIEQYPAAKR